jgi:hypothetical protein
MKKNRILSLLTLTCVSLVLLQSWGGGYTGAIVAHTASTGTGCSGSGCHNPQSPTTNNGLTIDVLDASNNPITSYENNTTYKVRISLKKNNITSQLAAGFQCTIFDVGTNNSQGSFPGISGNTHVQAPNIGGKVVLTHKTSNVNAIVSGSTVNWEFDWKTSLLGSGDINISVIANDANSDQTSAGDAITYTSKFLIPSAPASVGDYNTGIDAVYPNPTTGNLNVKLTNSKASTISIYSITGQMMKQIKGADQNISLDVSDLVNGNYIITMEQEGASARQQFVKY